jgi:heme oxygenase (biliverdin-producing, ferredoxin)
MPALIAGGIERRTYCTLLRNLHALYETLEHGLDVHAEAPAVAPVRIPALYRAKALADDLDTLCGRLWRDLPLAATMQAYLSRLREIARAQPALLPAHAYVRYLGDLHGGQILRGAVRRALGDTDGAGMAFYAFGSAGEVAALVRALRAGLDDLPVSEEEAAAIVAEAQDAFARHARLFEELATAS